MTHDDAGPVIAFFDVDNTLLRGASVYHLGRGAQRRGLLSLRDLLRFGWHQVRFIAVGEKWEQITGVRERALELVGGLSEAELIGVAEEVYDDFIAPMLWPETVELTREHLRLGHQVWLITATPVVIADLIATRLGLTGALGTLLESVDGRYSGHLLGHVLHGQLKAEAATGLAADVGADLAHCWAYSDSLNDIPLLELVGNRVAVNPDARLARHSRESGWRILRLRTSSIRRARRARRTARGR
ncbi:MAG: HAD family hydrolase [Burkholderiaceae bacterium]|nr:HAD family hydrolase [Microbacteriaceae bacterium]